MAHATAGPRSGAAPGPVSIVRCDGLRVRERCGPRCVRRLAPLGGMAAFVKPGERIGLKPNLLLGSDPDQAIITHPAVLAAVALAVKEAGATPIVVESPGSGIVPFAGRCWNGVFRKAGYREVADRYGFELSVDPEWEGVLHPDGRLFKRVEVMQLGPAGATALINLPKFKTHAFMIFTGATKNLFGVIPGLTKVGYHGKFAEPKRSPACCSTWPRSCAPGSASWTPSWRWRATARVRGARPAPRACSWPARDTVAMDVALLRHRRVSIPQPSRCWRRPATGACGAGGRPTWPTLGVPCRTSWCERLPASRQGRGQQRFGTPGFIGGIGRALLRERLQPQAAPPGGPLHHLRLLRAGLPGAGHHHGQEGAGGQGGRRQVHPLLLLP